MEIILSPDGSGKTLELIKRSAEEGSTIICRSFPDIERIINISETLGFNIPTPIYYETLINKSRILTKEEKRKGILIDDVDCILNMLFSPCIKAVVFSDFRQAFPKKLRFNKIRSNAKK